MKFEITSSDSVSRARTGKLTFPSGVAVETPVFMPVGTAGSVKTIHQRELEKDINAPIILGNTYHLYLKPGIETLEKAGGLHKFIGWDRLMLTDSGGFQVYSLSKIRKIDEGGVEFQSHIDGSSHLFTPEKVIDIQRSIGADILMAFDECTPYPCDYNYAKSSMELTHRWLDRCITQFGSTNNIYEREQTLFPIIQGSVYIDLRKTSAQYIADKDLKGIAIGGLSVGEPDELMYEMTAEITSILPEEKPRYLMGVGLPANILESVSRGIDMFDCVLPTRNARHGILYTPNGVINIKNKKWEHDFLPINEPPMSFIDEYYSRAYLRHLFQVKEYLALQIASLNNSIFYQWLMKNIRIHINKGDFEKWKSEMVEVLSKRL